MTTVASMVAQAVRLRDRGTEERVALRTENKRFKMP